MDNISNTDKIKVRFYLSQLCTTSLHRETLQLTPTRHVYGLKKAVDKGRWTTSGRIIPSIDFSCWVLQKETVGLSGQDPSALSLTKRVFSRLIRQKAYY